MRWKTKKWEGMIKILAIILMVSVLGLACTKENVSSTPENSIIYDITGRGNGFSLVPAVVDSATAYITGSYNAFNQVLTYNVMWEGLTGLPVSGGFYNGSSGVNGAAFGKLWVFDSTAIAYSAVSGQILLTDEQALALTGGNWYYSIATSANPGGELRGQITTVIKAQ